MLAIKYLFAQVYFFLIIVGPLLMTAIQLRSGLKILTKQTLIPYKTQRVLLAPIYTMVLFAWAVILYFYNVVLVDVSFYYSNSYVSSESLILLGGLCWVQRPLGTPECLAERPPYEVGKPASEQFFRRISIFFLSDSPSTISDPFNFVQRSFACS